MSVSRALGLREQDFDHEQGCSDHDRAVGKIKDWPLILAHVEEQEIDHTPASHTIPEISERAAKDQRERDTR